MGSVGICFAIGWFVVCAVLGKRIADGRNKSRNWVYWHDVYVCTVFLLFASLIAIFLIILIVVFIIV